MISFESDNQNKEEIDSTNRILGIIYETLHIARTSRSSFRILSTNTFEMNRITLR